MIAVALLFCLMIMSDQVYSGMLVLFFPELNLKIKVELENRLFNKFKFLYSYFPSFKTKNKKYIFL